MSVMPEWFHEQEQEEREGSEEDPRAPQGLPVLRGSRAV